MEKVDGFLYDILYRNYCDSGDTQTASAAAFLEKSEETIASFFQSDERSELEFLPLNSFYRRIIHCLGRRYGLVHRVEPTNLFNSTSTLRKIYLTKPVGTGGDSVLPILKSSDWIGGKEKPCGLIETSKKSPKPTKKTSKTPKVSVDKPKFKILKRSSDSAAVSPVTAPLLPQLETLSLQEREAKYQAARDRIFEGFTEDTGALIEGIESGMNILGVSTVNSTGDNEVRDNIITKDNNINSTDYSCNNSTKYSCNNSTEDSSNNSTDVNTPTDNTPTSGGLNPEAAPFSLDLISEEEEPPIEISHIYTVTPISESAQLSQEHFKNLLAAHPTATIKTRSVPTDFAFLLLSVSDQNGQLSLKSEHYQITKWIPEFYVD